MCSSSINLPARLAIQVFFPLYVEEVDSSGGLSVELLAGLVFSGHGFSMMFSA
jgi:hypothetical protein